MPALLPLDLELANSMELSWSKTALHCSAVDWRSGSRLSTPTGYGSNVGMRHHVL